MNVFVAGATGVLGRRLVAELTDRGHAAVGLSRDEEGDETVASRGGEPRRGDILDRESLDDAVGDADVVIHAATAIPTKRKPAPEDWEPNDRVNREGTRNLVAAATEAGADRYLQQSIVWVARQPDGSPFDEDAPTHPTRTTESALDAERIARNADGLDVGVLRCGWFHAPDAYQTRLIGRDLLAGDLPIVGGGLLGRGDAVLSYVHVDDAARAFAAATEGDATGLWHVVDEEPAPFADFVRTFADRLDAPPPGRVPGWFARFIVGRNTVRFLTNSMPTSNDRFRAAFDWEPAYPTYREGIEEIVRAWLDDGTLEPAGEGYRWTAEQ